MRYRPAVLFAVVLVASVPSAGRGQVAPSEPEVAAYTGVLAAAAAGDPVSAARLIRDGADPNGRDGHGRSALHVAAHRGDVAMLQALLRAGADPNAMDNQRYDVITIAAVRDDAATIRAAVAGGGKVRNVTSPYDGTALIAASHLGNVAAVRELLRHRPRVDHVNNLGWTALIEAVILGDGGARHTEVVRLLLTHGANPRIADRSGVTPRQHAERRGYSKMVPLLRDAERRLAPRR